MATNFVRGSYQEVIDLHTESDTVSVIGIHTPTSDTPIKMFPGFFKQYSQYHYDGCSMALVPAARLPADIAQVSYSAGTPPLDPRDLMNPILFKGCHGENMGTILSQFLNGPYLSTSGATSTLDASDSTEMHTVSQGMWQGAYRGVLENLYYRAMTDSTWAKAHPQKGFRKSGMHPLVYDLATNVNMNNAPGALSNVGPYVATGNARTSNTPETTVLNTGHDGAIGPGSTSNSLYASKPVGEMTYSFSDSNITMTRNKVNSLNFLSPRLRGLGWMDTRSRLLGPISSQTFEADSNIWEYRRAIENLMSQELQANEEYNLMPLLYMGMILLPPAYRTEQYFRLILTHRFSWRGFRGASLRDDKDAIGYDTYYNMNDSSAFNKQIDEDKEVDPLAEYFTVSDSD